MDSKRVTLVAVVLLVALRMSIGWQFLYEGLWKINTLSTSKPWTSKGYLSNARGPFRDTYRNMTGDADDLDWLDYDTVSTKWDAWQRRFVNTYELDERAAGRLNEMLNGKKIDVAELPELPDQARLPLRVTIEGGKREVLKYDEKKKRLVVFREWHLLPKEREVLKKRVPLTTDSKEEDSPANKLAKAYHKALDDVYARQARLSYKEQLKAMLKGDPERVGILRQEQEGTIDYEYPGEIDVYKKDLARYEQKLALAGQDFQHDHLNKQWAEIQQARAKLVGPIRALENDLKWRALKLLSAEQLALGSVPPANTQLRRVDMATIGALLILGVLLILGCATRVAALVSAGMLLSFYFVMPPWPGVPQPPGPEHSLFVNKNLIEAIALLGIAALPTGTWFGIDGLLGRLFLGRKSRKADSTPSEPDASKTQAAKAITAQTTTSTT